MATKENLRDVIARQNAAPQDNFAEKGAFTLFAEHRGSNESIGFFGGDAYPAAWVGQNKAGRRYGLALASDGLGSGNFVHPSLSAWLAGKGTEEDKLYAYLEHMFGKEFFADTEAVEYAVRNFLPVPPNCFFNDEHGVGQYNKAFYEKDSQYLSSRTVSVGVYYNFRHYFDDKAFTPANVAKLREEIEKYLDVTLRKRIAGIFSLDDAPNSDKRNKYFLPCTLACWFFEEQENTVLAAAYYVGDARAYKVDMVDGVMMISQDDANPIDNNMNCCIRYGDTNVENPQGMKDCAIKATYVELAKPCAVFACSDGVYDTCSARGSSNKLGLPAGQNKFAKYEQNKLDESNDLAFERNFLEILRKANSLDDLAQLTATHIYCHAKPDTTEGGTYSPVAECGDPGAIKRDDSATMGMVFFGMTNHGYPTLLDAMKDEEQVKQLSLIRLYDELEAQKANDTYCICRPPVDSEDAPDNIRNGVMISYAQAITSFIKPCVEADSTAVSERGKNTMWGIGIPGPIKGFRFNGFWGPNALDIFKKIAKEAKDIFAFAPRPKDKVAALSTHYDQFKQAYMDIAQCDAQLAIAATWKAKYEEYAKALVGRKKVMIDLRKQFDSFISAWDSFSKAAYAQQNGDNKNIYNDLCNAADVMDAENGKRTYGEFGALDTADLDKLNKYVAMADDQVYMVKMLSDIVSQCGQTQYNHNSLSSWMKTAENRLDALQQAVENNLDNENDRIKELNDMRKAAAKRCEAEAQALDEVLAKDRKTQKFIYELENCEGILTAWLNVKRGAMDYIAGKTKQKMDLPETIINKIPAHMQGNTDYVLNTYERYIAVNDLIAASLGKEYGMYNIEDKMDEDIKASLEASGNTYDSGIAASDAFEKAAVATRSEQPVANGEGYRAVYQAGARGFAK